MKTGLKTALLAAASMLAAGPAAITRDNADEYYKADSLF